MLKEDTTFGEWLKKKRGEDSLRTFAKQVGVDSATISRTERNCTEVLVPTAVRIGRGLELSFTDFFQDWLGKNPVVTKQSSQETWLGALTGQEVQCWLLRLLEGHRRNQEMLLAVLNLIVLHSGITSRPLPQMQRLFGQGDIEKILWDLSWFRFEVAPPLHCESVLTDLPLIHRRGGLVLPCELGAYIGLLRRQRGFDLKRLSEATQIPIGTLSSVEKGMMKHFKLYDLLHLDDCLQCGGELIALYWWEVSNRQAFEQEWNVSEGTMAYSLRVKHTLMSLLISVGRWLQVIYQNDTLWHSTIRYELGLTKPTLVVGRAC